MISLILISISVNFSLVISRFRVQPKKLVHFARDPNLRAELLVCKNDNYYTRLYVVV